MKGQEKNKDNKEYKVPVLIFDATRPPENSLPPDKPQTKARDEIPGNHEHKRDKKIENDFLFPLHLIF